MAEIPEEQRMVVGVDGSPGSVVALRWAAARGDVPADIRFADVFG